MLLESVLVEEILHVWRPGPAHRLLLLDVLKLQWTQPVVAVDVLLKGIILQ